MIILSVCVEKPPVYKSKPPFTDPLFNDWVYHLYTNWEIPWRFDTRFNQQIIILQWCRYIFWTSTKFKGVCKRWQLIKKFIIGEIATYHYKVT